MFSRKLILSGGLVAITGILVVTAGLSAMSHPRGRQGMSLPIVVSSAVPTDLPQVSQLGADNIAWQEFIALNWVADPNNCGEPDPNVPKEQFGVPNDTRPVVWESYKNADGIFLKQGKQPGPWCSKEELPSGLNLRGFAANNGGQAKPKETSPFGFKTLLMTSELDASLHLQSIAEAGTGGAWLTAQNGHPTLYEERVNQDEFKFIVDKKLYDAANQAPLAVSPTGFNLPDGTTTYGSYGTVGAIEIKAAWIELDDPSQWPNFKTSKAYVVYPDANTLKRRKAAGSQLVANRIGTNPPKLVTVGLVGLHIIHKVAKDQQLVWATFEHIDNCPDKKDISDKSKLKSKYTYYNPGCDPSTDHYKCEVNHMPDPKTDPINAPVQVARVLPIAADPGGFAPAANNTAWKAILAANPNSVFQHYQLVNAIWANSNTPIKSGATTPLTTGNEQPPKPFIVANTTLETYFQGDRGPNNTLNCLDCHTNAAIASPKTKPPYASNYSFLFGRAQTASTH